MCRGPCSRVRPDRQCDDLIMTSMLIMMLMTGHIIDNDDDMHKFVLSSIIDSPLLASGTSIVSPVY